MRKKSKKVEGVAMLTDGCNPELVDGARCLDALGEFLRAPCREG